MIGLGGSGLRTLLHAQELIAQSKQLGMWTPEVHLFGIDLWPTQEIRLNGGGTIPDENLLGLWTHGTTANDYVSALDISAPITEIAGWRYFDPTPPGINVDRSCRALSRTVFSCRRVEAERRLREVLDSAILGTSNPDVYVVTSMSGSSGSALYLDVCDMVTSILGDTSRPTGVVISPSFLVTFGAPIGNRSILNSLAAFSEFANAALSRTPRGPAETVLVGPASDSPNALGDVVRSVAESILVGELLQQTGFYGVRTFNSVTGGQALHFMPMSEIRENPNCARLALNTVAKEYVDRIPEIQINRFSQSSRCQTLAHSLPIDADEINAMIRGWFTGRIFGLIDVGEGDELGIQISQPWTDDPAPASFPVSTRVRSMSWHPGDKLIAVLESLSNAYLEFSITGDRSSFNAHNSLRDLGTMMDGSNDISRYEKPNPLIRGWILGAELTSQSGASEHGVKSESEIRAGLRSSMIDRLIDTTGGDAVSRKFALLALINEIHARYEKEERSFWKVAESNRRLLNSELRWPLLVNSSTGVGLISQELMTLRGAIASFSVDMT